ncbi:hypothetical protein NDU88_006379 [Pleurodeles waltl]|uniref:Uncharacterized protein n=1 Tax=Pleurodeles waltl TaxID=8319 RepID=A0AAV7NRM9_PLEWA|nr:hypothetical protein NDU88_006379 [Pleurodeles waltl]
MRLYTRRNASCLYTRRNASFTLESSPGNLARSEETSRRVNKKVSIDKGREICALGRRGWILLSAYRKLYEKCLQLQKDHEQLGKELVEARNSSTMLAGQNKLLSDTLEMYQLVAERTAVSVAKYKHKKRRGKVNKKKVHLAISQAGLAFDPEFWDGNIWDTSDFSDGSGGDDCQDVRQEKTERRNVVRAQPIYRRKLQHSPANPGGVMLDALEDYTQQELSDVIDRFRQRSGETLLT